MNAKAMILLVLGVTLIGSISGRPQLFRRPLIGLRRLHQFPNQQGFFPQQQGFIPQQQGFVDPGFGGGSAAGLGNGFVQGGQAVGTGTGIANPGPGGFGIGLGIGAAVATPLGNFAVGDGSSISVGK